MFLKNTQATLETKPPTSSDKNALETKTGVRRSPRLRGLAKQAPRRGVGFLWERRSSVRALSLSSRKGAVGPLVVGGGGVEAFGERGRGGDGRALLEARNAGQEGEPVL